MKNNDGSELLSLVPLFTTATTAAYAYVTSESMTGLKGVFAAAMTGAGTTIGATVHSLFLGAAALVIGGGIARLRGKDKQTIEDWAFGSALIAIVLGGAYGVYNSYGYAKDIAVNGTLPRPEILEVIPRPNETSLRSNAEISALLIEKYPLSGPLPSAMDSPA